MNPVERNLARVLIQIRQANFVQQNTSSEGSSSEEYREFYSDYDQEHFNDLIREKINLENWNKNLKEGCIDTAILDNLILNFLLKSGLKNAAAKFLNESGLSFDKKLENKINNLCEEISALLTEGKIEETVQRINQIDGSILLNKKELWLEILSYKLKNNLDALNSFAKNDLVKILDKCENEQEKQKLINIFEDLTCSWIVDGNPPFELDSTMKEISKRILEYYDINPATTIEEILKLTYSTQDKLKNQCEIPKLTSKKFNENANFISD